MFESKLGEMVPDTSRPSVIPKFDMHIHVSILKQHELNEVIETYSIPVDLNPCLPPSELTMNKLLENIIVYRHPEYVQILRNAEGREFTMDAYLLLLTWTETVVSKGDVVPENEHPPKPAIGERPAEVMDDSKWDEMDGNAFANLHLAVADGVLSSIEEKKSAKEIWDHLARLYEARSLHNKFFLKRKIYALHMTESTLVTEHLTSLSCKIDSQERAEILLQTLPDSYDQVIINLTNNVLSDYLVFDDVAAAILEEENRHNNREDRQTSSRQVEALVVTRGRSIEFGSSGSHNHGNIASTSEDGNALCCEAAIANENRKKFTDVWLFDTGATFHMSARREWFHQYKPISGGGSMYSCNYHELKIIGIGSIMVKMHDGTVRIIQDVRHMEGLKKNLLSLGQLDDLGCKVEIENKIIKIIKGALVLMRGEKVAAKLYQLNGEIMEEAEASVASHSLSHRVAITWHQKLGHIKQHRLKLKTLNSKSVYVLKLVHSDVWQVLVLSLRGAKYFVSFIDDYSRRCKKESRQFTTTYTPQHNRVAERMNITLLERARAMLTTASLGKSFWAEAVNTACYVINRSPSTAVELKTPIEIWTEKPINYSDLHIFGSHVQNQENEEGDSTTREITSIQMEKEFQSNDSFETTPQHEVNETTESQAPATRTLNHEKRRPGWHSDYVMESNVAYCLLTEEGEPSTLQEALNNPDASFWKEAMQEEIEALHKNKTWELVPLPGGRKPIGNKWVYKIKKNDDDQVERYRERLVVKGYAQKEGIEFNKIFSHVVRMTTIRVVLAMCATYDLHLEQLDVKTAFLYGNLKEEIYMLQPEGFKQKGKKNLVCRSNKSLYGLKQASRCWYKRFDSFIMSLECNRLHVDPYTYFKRFRNNDFIILLLYVDDMLVACPNKDRINKLKAHLTREFEMKDLGPANKILGMQIYRDRVSMKIWLSQKSYVKKILQRFNMQDLGSLMFAMICTRSDIAHAVGVVSRYMAKPGRQHWEAVKRIRRYIKGTSDVALCFGDSNLIVKGYSVVAMSTIKAKYVAAAQARKEVVWLKMLLEELGHKQENITLFCDNESALYLARNLTFHSKTKHIRVQYHFVHEKVEEGTVDMLKIHTDDNVKEYQEKDKIRSKPNKNGKRGEARKSQKQLQ
nr:retrovirus-related Pol polyprotein from transposon TNT 1-94 [Tanacetum cinerariifolium]